MFNSNTNYQTSFRVEDPKEESFMVIQQIILDWLTSKERDEVLKRGRKDFMFRCDWPSLFRTHASITTDTYLSPNGKAWAVRYTHADKDMGPRRYWYSDIGLRQIEKEVVVFVKISYAWNTEDLGHEQDSPQPSVPFFVRRILESVTVYSGRREFRLVQTPALFKEVGQGKTLCDFITSRERKYPLIVINGDSKALMTEAKALAVQLTGKCQVAVIAENQDLADEIRHYIDKEYRIGHGKLRVFFPFTRQFEAVTRHRWYDIASPEYAEQRNGIINGLLRNNALLETESIASINEVRQLISRSRLMALRTEAESQSAEMQDFYKLFDEVEKERDDYKLQSEHFANDVDSLEEQVRQLSWKANELQSRLDVNSSEEISEPVHQLLPRLPSDLEEAVKAAVLFYSRLEFTESALRSAKEAAHCECVEETWEILGQLNNLLYRIKFEDPGVKDLEAKFGAESRYQLAMSEGRNTKRDARLMGIRQITHNNQSYDITPHIKYGTKEPKMVRIHFAFDDARKKIVVGFVGSHMENATSKNI